MKQGLVVDDSAVIRKVASRILELLHFETVEADDASKVLERCSQSMPDVILLDWAMPQTDSVELVRTVRRLPGGANTKIIYCATENDPMMIGRALRAGADEFLLKPFDRRTMQEKFEDIGLIA
jgi:two-component system chemotaxis response regulator CheY